MTELAKGSFDMLVSFIKWSGLRCIIEELREFTEQENHTLKATGMMRNLQVLMELLKKIRKGL